ncbi:hypothetical protein [Flagellimonas sp. CMM7]|uniref:hypothetical protein n=1 Tax=Flagellimonas sp. CMM7 TaxID=2654676 RepID=UPI0013D44CEB|nr:hypothetical protein [Flagellimonas sp. CMM7]UII79984.1 hypothetical protein LV704_00335 [Flagellimonas sp. CMM7]
MLDKDFTSNRYSAILGNLKDNNYLTQSDVDVLLKDLVANNSVMLTNVGDEKAEIVRRALFANNNRKNYR